MRKLGWMMAIVVVTLAAYGSRTGFINHNALAHAGLQASAALRVGAVYPLSGPQGTGGRQEYDGLQTAAAIVNASGGVHGRPISLISVDAPSADAAPDAVDGLARKGLRIITGSYGSTISLPASYEAQRDGLIFWESGAVATMITQRGLPNVFRTVTTGDSLGRAAARYAAQIITPRLHLTPPDVRVAVVYVRDVYGTSVGTAMAAEARRQRFDLVGVLSYDPYHPQPAAVVTHLKALRPDIVLVVDYVQDAVAMRREVLRQGLHPAAMIGTSSAYCMQAFGDTLGPAAVGLFASDKPDATFNGKALLPAARQLRSRAVHVYEQRFHSAMTAASVAGFVAGWVLFHEVLPHAQSLTTAAIRRAALDVNLPYGSEINGAGVKFAPPGAPDEGQNLRAISVIWQWQRPGHAAIVYPPAYATSSPRLVPLPGWRHG